MSLFQKLVCTLPTYFMILLVLVVIIADHLIIHSKTQIVHAVFDNSAHFIIGGLSWIIVCLMQHHKNSPFQTILEAAGCALIASLIDLDHFLAAKSFSLKDATSLRDRPPLHCSTFPLLICILILLINGVFETHLLKRSTLIVLTAFTSHHTRDAARRGYWFYPYGSTPPISYLIHLILICGIPYVISIINNSMYSSYNQNINIW